MTSGSRERSVTKAARWALVLLGGVLGAMIGPTGFWLRGLDATDRLYGRGGSFPPPPERWTAALATIGSSGPQMVFMVLAFIGTILLMPTLIAWLERRAGSANAAFYPRAAVAGIVLGIGATILTSIAIFLTALVVGQFDSSEPPSADANAVALVSGAVVFAPLVGVVMPFFFAPWIALFGVPFGLFFAALVRRFAKTKDA